MSSSVRLAAIDIGTVTTRLLVADVDAGQVVEVERSTDITHLGEGLTETGCLSAAAMARVEGVIARYADRIRALEVVRTAVVATSASRDAENSDAFRVMLGRHGLEPLIITGAREAELSFTGATAMREGDGLLVVDCGGGSTELILGDVTVEDEVRTQRIELARSIDIGSRRMTELFLHADPPTPAQLGEARGWAVELLRGYFGMVDERPREVIALAGTATTLAAISLEMAEYDSARVHGYRISGSEVSDILEMLSALPLVKRRDVVGLHPERAGVIVAGALILETVLAMAGVDGLTVSEHDILYGILLDTLSHLREQG